MYESVKYLLITYGITYSTLVGLSVNAYLHSTQGILWSLHSNDLIEIVFKKRGKKNMYIRNRRNQFNRSCFKGQT